MGLIQFLFTTTFSAFFPPRIIVVGEGEDVSEMAHHCLGWARERIMGVSMGATERRL